MEKTILSVNEQTIALMERYAKLFMPIDSIAVLLGIEEWLLREVLEDDDHALSVAYRRGKALAQLELRQANYDLFVDGSSEALSQMTVFFDEMNASEV